MFDGLPGLDNAFRETYPKADVQHCIVHKVRSTFPKIRVQDKTDFIDDLKTIYNALDYDLAMAAFDTVKAKWGKKYPKEIQSWEDQLPTLLTFYKYPALIKEAIYTSNPIERMNKELRKQLKPMIGLTNIDAAEKIIYLDAIEYNERFENRVIRGFGDPEVKKNSRSSSKNAILLQQRKRNKKPAPAPSLGLRPKKIVRTFKKLKIDFLSIVPMDSPTIFTQLLDATNN